MSLGNYAQVTNGTGGRVLHYFLTDRLGSVDAVTDDNGLLIETRGYDAFGAPRTGVWGDATQLASTAITPKGFTSHEHLNSVQLIHMNGRMYDYQLGRFLGVDPFIQMPTNSQSFNPYSYIMNNPLSGTDPTGYQSIDPSGCNRRQSCQMRQNKLAVLSKDLNDTINGQGSTGGKIGLTLRVIAIRNNGTRGQTPKGNVDIGDLEQTKDQTIDITDDQGYGSGDRFERNSYGHRPFQIDSIFGKKREITRHHYDVETLICQKSDVCTYTILSAVLKIYSYPTWKLGPTEAPDGGFRLVRVVSPSALMEGDMNDPENYTVPGGWIQQGSAEGGGIMNVTLRAHIVYPGIIIRQIIERDGSLFIQTHGMGYNMASNIGNVATKVQVAGNLQAALANDVGGYRAFKALDNQAKKYYEKTYSK